MTLIKYNAAAGKNNRVVFSPAGKYSTMTIKGLVSLVGSGPGDPDLLTVKALRLLREADVVVFDRLVSAEIMALIPPGVTRISAAKAPGRHAMPQAEINRLLVDLALSGRTVVRLKGGDPCIFGRGGEEALELKRHGIPFEIVPGITAAAGCSAYAGIPLTHRGLSRGVRLVTGQRCDADPLEVDWERVAEPDTTLVIYMGLANLAEICGRLLAAGLDPATPAAAIHGGTTAGQRRVISVLARLPAEVERAALSSPVTVVVGAVVALAGELDWYGGLPAAAREHDDVAPGLARA